MTDICIRLNDDGSIYMLDHERAEKAICEWCERTGSALYIEVKHGQEPNPFNNFPPGQIKTPGMSTGGRSGSEGY